MRELTTCDLDRQLAEPLPSRELMSSFSLSSQFSGLPGINGFNGNGNGNGNTGFFNGNFNGDFNNNFANDTVNIYVTF